MEKHAAKRLEWLGIMPQRMARIVRHAQNSPIRFKSD